MWWLIRLLFWPSWNNSTMAVETHHLGSSCCRIWPSVWYNGFWFVHWTNWKFHHGLASCIVICQHNFAMDDRLLPCYVSSIYQSAIHQELPYCLFMPRKFEDLQLSISDIFDHPSSSIRLDTCSSSHRWIGSRIHVHFLIEMRPVCLPFRLWILL